MLSKSDIQARQKQDAIQEHEVDSLGGTLRFRKLRASAVIAANDNKKNGDAILIARSVLDENDEQMFTGQEASELNADVFAELGAIIARVNGWNTDPDEIEKN